MLQDDVQPVDACRPINTVLSCDRERPCRTNAAGHWSITADTAWHRHGQTRPAAFQCLLPSEALTSWIFKVIRNESARPAWKYPHHHNSNDTDDDENDEENCDDIDDESCTEAHDITSLEIRDVYLFKSIVQRNRGCLLGCTKSMTMTVIAT